MDRRVYNFSAGPAVLPLRVLEEAQRDLLVLPGAGMSILEMSHRSKPFEEILEQTKQNIRKLLALPEDYHILFLQGGASLQFAMVPMNFLRPGAPANYIVTGSWGQKAVEEAAKFGPARVIWNGEESGFRTVPSDAELSVDANAAYVHLTSNETIQGLQFSAFPNLGNVPVVCDMSSDFLSRPIDVRKFAMIYAGAQKNAGPAGVTIVIVRDEWLQHANGNPAKMLAYQTHVDANSLYNTPPTFAIYIVMLVTRWLLEDMGALEEMAALNARKAQLVYDVIDHSDGFYKGCVDVQARSRMNITFRLPTEPLEAEFVKQARAQGLYDLKGHRTVGGIRASLYNAMPLEGVECLVQFMRDFAQQRS